MKDFFISYNHADSKWAEWIAWQLEEAGYSTIIQAWDFKAGNNFVLEMDRATKEAERTIAVLSDDYLNSRYTKPEWAEAFRRDPTGENGLLLPVRVQECSLSGLPAAIIYIDLVGLDEKSAQSTLLNRIRSERGKPEQAPTFPGSTPNPQTKSPIFPANLPWNVPVKRNPFFTGREEVLEELEKHLSAGGSAALGGLGGVGKTQTTTEYAYRHRGDYQAVLWAGADSQDALVSGFVALAGLLNLPAKDAQDQEIIVAAVQRWLTTNRDFLLILDNADDLKLVQKFLPSGRQGHLLLTTRAQATGALAPKVEIRKMEKGEGALFLLRRAKRISPDAVLAAADVADQENALSLSQELDGLPLALDQAGAYLEETGCGLTDYLELYQTHGFELLKLRGELSEAHPDPVAVTWSLSFEKIQAANPAAAELLNLCAFLHADAIPEELFSEGAEELGPVLGPIAADAFQLNAAIKEVLKYSLLHRDPTAKTLDIHRLVQMVLQKGMEVATRRQWAERAVRVVNRVFPAPEVSNWSRCERLLSHTQKCAEWIDKEGLEFEEAAHLLNQAGYSLYVRGRYSEAEPLYEYALKIREQVFGLKSSNVAVSLNNLAMLYYTQGRYTEAEPLHKRALEIVERKLGSGHPEVAVNLNNLAILYHAQARYAEAEPLIKRALRIVKQVLGLEHPDVAQSLNNLGMLYYAQRRYAEAEPLLKCALTIREKTLGQEHLDLATSLNNLASLYDSQGRHFEAEPLFLRALAIKKKTLGQEHPDVATSLNNLASLCDSQGRNFEAESLYKQALEMREHTLGSEHPEVAGSLNNLASLYRSQGKLLEAEPLFRRAVVIMETALGSDHPNVATSLNNLALLYNNQCRYAEAEPLHKRALTIRKKALGLDHPDVAQSLNNLAVLYFDQSRYVEAEYLYKRSLAIREEALGPDHPDVANSLNNLAGLYFTQDRYAEAEPLYQRALEVFEITLGLDHPNTIQCSKNYQALQEKLKRVEDEK